MSIKKVAPRDIRPRVREAVAVALTGGLGAFICGFAILVIVGLVRQHETLPRILEEGALYALWYGLPVGVLVFAVSFMALKRRLDLRRWALVLIPFTIVAGCIGAFLWDLVISIVAAVVGYLIGCVVVLIISPRART
jgi:hypothetical protein